MADLIKITVDSSDVVKATQYTNELTAANDRLEKELKPLLAKEKEFQRAIRQVNEAMRLNVITNKQAIAQVQALGKQYGYTQAQIDRTTASMTGIRKNTNRMNAVIQNAGYQFGDFFVQVQSGQNILVAFSQQGAQLAGLMPGLAGAVTGVGLVIGSMLARALLEGTDLFKSFAEASDEAKTAIEDLTSASTAFNSALQGTVGPGAERFAEVVLRKKYNTAVKETTDQLKKLKEELSPQTERSFFSPMNLIGIGGMLDASKALSIVAIGAFEARVEMVRLIEAINKPLDFNDMEELDQRLGDIGSLIEEFEDQLTPKQLTGLVDAYTAVYERQQQLQEGNSELGDGTEEITDELERQEALLKRINDLERQRLSIGEGLDKAFARSTLVLEGMERGLSKSISSQLANIRMQIDAERKAFGEEYFAQQSAIEGGANLVPTIFPADIEVQFQARMEQLKELEAQLLRQEELSSTSSANRLSEEELLQKRINETLNSREKQMKMELSLLDLSEEEAEITKFIYELEKSLGVERGSLSAEQEEQFARIIALKEEYIQKTLEQKAAEEKLKKEVEAYNKVKQKANDIASVMANETVGALKSIVNGTKTASQAFRDMALNIIQQIMDILIWQPLIQSLTNSISGAISGSAGGGGTVGGIVSSIFGFQKGGAFSAGNVVPFANGGIVGSPTYFGMAGGRTGLMGEAGPEAIMPLKRGPNGKLGVEGGGNVTVNQSFNFAANGDESVKKIIAEAAPGIAKMTEAQIVNSRQRGGQMRRVFS